MIEIKIHENGKYISCEKLGEAYLSVSGTYKVAEMDKFVTKAREVVDDFLRLNEKLK